MRMLAFIFIFVFFASISLKAEDGLSVAYAENILAENNIFPTNENKYEIIDLQKIMDGKIFFVHGLTISNKTNNVILGITKCPDLPLGSELVRKTRSEFYILSIDYNKKTCQRTYFPDIIYHNGVTPGGRSEFIFMGNNDDTLISLNDFPTNGNISLIKYDLNSSTANEKTLARANGARLAVHYNKPIECFLCHTGRAIYKVNKELNVMETISTHNYCDLLTGVVENEDGSITLCGIAIRDKKQYVVLWNLKKDNGVFTGEKIFDRLGTTPFAGKMNSGKTVLFYNENINDANYKGRLIIINADNEILLEEEKAFRTSSILPAILLPAKSGDGVILAGNTNVRSGSGNTVKQLFKIIRLSGDNEEKESVILNKNLRVFINASALGDKMFVSLKTDDFTKRFESAWTQDSYLYIFTFDDEGALQTPAKKTSNITLED